jgi:predicted N-acetyltransferase YhbS
MFSTRACFRRRGIGLAMTWHAANEARRAGAGHIVLQASAQGEPVYRRLGFTPLGLLTEYQMRA